MMKVCIATGMWVQALGIGTAIVSTSFAGFAAGSLLLGTGTAMVYPTLLAAIGDVALPHGDHANRLQAAAPKVRFSV